MVVRAGRLGHPVLTDEMLELTDVALGTIISCFGCCVLRIERKQSTREESLHSLVLTTTHDSRSAQNGSTVRNTTVNYFHELVPATQLTVEVKERPLIDSIHRNRPAYSTTTTVVQQRAQVSERWGCMKLSDLLPRAKSFFARREVFTVAFDGSANTVSEGSLIARVVNK